MAVATQFKSGPIEGEKTQFRTQMVNGKPQIYFDVIDDSSMKPRSRQNNRATNVARPSEQPPRPINNNNKPSIQTLSNKPVKKANKVTFSDDKPAAGIYMTMDEITELVNVVKENTLMNNNIRNDPPVARPPPALAQPTYQEFNQVLPTNAITNTESQISPPLAPISPRQEALGMMADKKRQKWLRERAEMDRMRLEVQYDQLKHQLAPTHQKSTTSPERSTVPLDFSPNNKPPIPPSIRQDDNTQNEMSKTRLLEKKQQQWKQENAEKAPVWNPFGRPGAGAPNANEIQTKFTQPQANTIVSYRPPDASFSNSSNLVLNDQTRVPAAMRTNLLFGDVRFEDDVRTAKEIERRQWLDDLQRQIEENKRKKSTQQENERRQDFLQENIQPLVQEAANRHNQQQQNLSPRSTSNPSVPSTTVPESNKSNRHDSLVQQTYDKIVEATELAKYEKKAQLIEKLRRNGHKTDLLAKTLPDAKALSPVSTQKINERTQDSSPKKTIATKIEPLHLNANNDQQNVYRVNENRRDEAVNTIDSTFRSDNSVQTDLRIPPQKQMFSFTREESDLPPQVPNNLVRSAKQNKKNVRIKSLEDNQRQRRASITTTHSNRNHTYDDGATSQLGTNRSNHGVIDILHRPLWNYQNQRHREYIPNSKRDPNYEKRARQKHVEQGNFDRIDDVQKKENYNRWNSDSELQQKSRIEKKINPVNRTRSTVIKQNNSKDESIINLLKRQPKQETFVPKKHNDGSDFTKMSLDKYEHFVPYTRTDEVLNPNKAFSPVPLTREPTPLQHTSTKTKIHDDHHRRQNDSTQPPPYHIPPSRQEHILQQLTAIKENLVRRQQEVATSMNAIPV